MAEWKHACKTIRGMGLDLKLDSRGLPLKLTKAKSGAGKTSPTQLMALQDILEPVQVLQIQDAVERLGESTIRLPVILKNEGMEKYDMHQLGIYAEDPDEGEILYIVLQSDSAEEIPAYREMKDFTLEWYINLSVGNTNDITVVIDEMCNITVEQADARYVFKDGDASETTIEFIQAEGRVNIEGGEKQSTLFGKIKKYFSDMKNVAFSGSYNDLSDKPSIPAAIRVKGSAEGAFRVGDVNITPANIGLGNVDNTADANKNVNSAKALAVQPDNWKQGTDLPSTYPRGATVFLSNNPANKFNGITYCTIHTIKGYTNMACIQFLYPYNSNEDRFYFREALYNTDAWRPWHEVISSANIASQSVNYATSAGSATKAAKDANGNNIPDTYAKRSIYGDNAISMNRRMNTAVGGKSVAIGYVPTASGENSAAFGYFTAASGENSAAFGDSTAASGENSAAFGYSTTASGQHSFAMGDNSKATGGGALAVGGFTESSNQYSFAMGNSSKASGQYSFAGGLAAAANNYASSAIGKYNKALSGTAASDTQIGDVFVIGNGTGSSNLSNALRISYKGDILGIKAFQSSGADYAEQFEFLDGNPDNEDRVGYFVTFAGEWYTDENGVVRYPEGKIRIADEGDYILGIVSGNPSIIGNSDEDYYWRYKRDEFNRIVMEDVPETKPMEDEDGNLILDEETHEPIMVPTGKIIPNARMKLADGYDPSLQDSYIPRAERPEWDYVGMLGVLPVRDDGTCLPGHFCKCGQGGVATLAEKRDFDTFHVIERISDNVVSVIMK